MQETKIGRTDNLDLNTRLGDSSRLTRNHTVHAPTSEMWKLFTSHDSIGELSVNEMDQKHQNIRGVSPLQLFWRSLVCVHMVKVSPRMSSWEYGCQSLVSC